MKLIDSSADQSRDGRYIHFVLCGRLVWMVRIVFFQYPKGFTGYGSLDMAHDLRHSDGRGQLSLCYHLKPQVSSRVLAKV